MVFGRRGSEPRTAPLSAPGHVDRLSPSCGCNRPCRMWTEPSRASTMRSEHDVVNAIVAFVATAYALSIALSLIVALTGGYGGPLIGLRYLSMFLPAIAVLVAASATHEKPRVRSDFLPLRYVPVALFLVPFVMHAVMVPAMAVTGGLQWQDWLTPQSDGLYYTPASRGWGTLTLQGLAGRIVLNAIGGLAVASFLSFFEEIGWRAWLLPRLHDRMGPRSAVVLTAIIWALWNPAHRRRLAGQAGTHVSVRHHDRGLDLRLALAADGERVDRIRGSRLAQQLEPVRVQVHERRPGNGFRLVGARCGRSGTSFCGKCSLVAIARLAFWDASVRRLTPVIDDRCRQESCRRFSPRSCLPRDHATGFGWSTRNTSFNFTTARSAGRVHESSTSTMPRIQRKCPSRG
jgi:membrane protease YdiL (CAAX protease family)